MKKTTIVNGLALAISMVAMTLLASCGSATTGSKDAKETKTAHENQEAKGTKGNWTQSERVEFLTNCRVSAVKSYEQRGQAPDTAIINTLCICAGKAIEEKYSAEESENIKPEEGLAIMKQAAADCLPKK